MFNEVVENKSGLCMTSAERITFLRQKATDMDFFGKVREINYYEKLLVTLGKVGFGTLGKKPFWKQLTW